AFAARYDQSASGGDLSVRSWQQLRDADAMVVRRMRLILLTGSWLLALLAVASVVVLVGGRMSEQTRRVGLLKAVGGTPRLVAVLLLVEHLFIGACAAGVGILAGWLAAPLLDRPGAGLLGAPGAPSLTGATVALAAGMALAVSAVATFLPAIRAARKSTVAALEGWTRPPRRRSWAIRLSAHLPAPLLLGARFAARRPRRLLLTLFSVAVTSSGLVAILILKATTGSWSLGPRVTQATTIISVMLVVLAALNAIVIAWATALDVRHAAALARALGATPGGITAGLAASQLLPSLLGTLLGVPGGIAVYDLAKQGGSTVVPAALPLIAIVVGSLVAVAVLTAIPVRIGARRPAGEALQAESG
ncbi:MAG: ABC transporter permease, partial [Actinomycetota bacterium]